MDADTLARAMGIPADRAAQWAAPLSAAMQEFAVVGQQRVAMFLATLNHESAGLLRLEENLNYSAQALAKTWPRRFALPDGAPNELAIDLQRRAMAIANEVYANRMGNGSRDSGDGWTFRGRGPIQLTGRANYRAMGKRLGMELEHSPDRVLEPAIGATVAAAFWYDAGCNDAADQGDFDKVSDLINRGRHTEAVGDSIGWQDRLAKYESALQGLA